MIKEFTSVSGDMPYSHKYCTKIPCFYVLLKFCMVYSLVQTESKLQYGWVIGISVCFGNKYQVKNLYAWVKMIKEGKCENSLLILVFPAQQEFLKQVHETSLCRILYILFVMLKPCNA